jgi:hypothetical protein
MNRVLHYFKNNKFNPLINRYIFEKGKKKYSGNNSTLRTTVRKFSTYNKQNPPPSPEKPLWFIVVVASGCELLNIVRNNK